MKRMLIFDTSTSILGWPTGTNGNLGLQASKINRKYILYQKNMFPLVEFFWELRSQVPHHKSGWKKGRVCETWLECVKRAIHCLRVCDIFDATTTVTLTLKQLESDSI